MSNTFENNFNIPATANYTQHGTGTPVIMIHGVAASLHDWDDLIPDLSPSGYECFALDLLGHGDSPKLDSRAYHMDWIIEHFSRWMTSLQLTQPAILIGHSLGGYIALEYARRASAQTRGLILVNPLYSRSQLPFFLQRSYSRRNLRGKLASLAPRWMLRMIVDLSSRAMGHGIGALHTLPEHIRAQTALDYTRTAPGVYNIPTVISDMTEYLPGINIPTLVIWGDRDQTLAPASFSTLVAALPDAKGNSLSAGHVPHQSNTVEFNAMVVEFLKGLA